jgi:transglutaminase-like putative cysteine protease
VRHILACLIWLAASLVGLAAGAVELERAETPGWVDEIPLPAAEAGLRAQSPDGVVYILSDHQTRWQGAERQSWTRTAVEVQDRAGLEIAATITFDYDPAFETVALTRLVVWRDGQEIDLKPEQPAIVMRREERLEEGILDGALTVFLQVPDVRVGDVVDYAVLRHESPVLPAGTRSVYSELEWSVPVVLSRSVVAWPADWPLNLGALPGRVVHVEGPLPDGSTRHEWQRIGHVPPQWEDNVPLADDPTAILRLSAETDWGAISAALAPFYGRDYPLGQWEPRIAAIAAASKDPGARAIAALRMVQDELRYVSLSLGAGGIFARPPEEVVASGFGDCKDKALLLAVMLKRLGVEGTVALTSLDAGHALPREVPMLSAFDHAIVRIRLQGAEHWVDPTATHQGGDLATATPPDYGHALPLADPGEPALLALPVTAERLWSTDVLERYGFDGAGVTVTIASDYRGGAADEMRARWAVTAQSRITDDFYTYYATRYPGLDLVAPIEMRDDRAGNHLHMVEHYRLPAAALADYGLDASFPFAAEDFASNLPERLVARRALPMDSGAPALFHHRIEVTGAPIDFTPPPPVRIDNGAFRYALSAAAPGAGALVLDWSFRRKGAVIPAAKVAALLADRQRVFDTTWFTWNVRP